MAATVVPSKPRAAFALAFTLALLPFTFPSQAQGVVTVTRTVSFDYDSYGALSRQTIEPGDMTLAYKLVTDYALDSYGSILTRTLSWQDPILHAPAPPRVVETNVYDSRSRFAIKVTNAAGHSESRTYDDAYGNLTSLTGPNLLTTNWQYDNWGRKTKETRADNTATTWSYRQCVDTCSNGATSVVVTQSWAGTSQASVPSEAFADTLGRNIRSRTWGFDGTAILSERIYDASGHLYQTSRPRFAGASAVWTTLFYDAIGRVTQSQSPSASGSGVDTTTTSYSGLAVTTTNPLTQSRTETRNGLGTLKSVTDAYAQTTTYLYDPWGNLTRTTDPLLNQINVAYDQLGRKTQLADPNLGTWNYLVDPLGQTYSQTDAKTQVTSYTFDVLGRMTRRLEPDMDSRWDYDSATTGVGKLAETYTWVAGAKDFRRIYAYDTTGRTSAVTTSLDWDYVTESQYDAYGRLYRHNYRRNAKGGSGGPFTAVYNVYNATGYVAQIYRSTGSGTDPLIEQIVAMDAEGHVTSDTYGTGGTLVTSRQFNVYTGRLQGITSGTSGATASLQNDGYTYDSLGNVTFRSQLADGSGALMSESFGYDNLNRLTSSVVWGQATKTTGYDALGNVTTKDSVGAYTYFPSGGGSSHPNALASIAGTVAGVANPSFGYDANGNTVNGLGTTNTWMSFNKPSSIDSLSGGAAVQRTAWLYDTDHQRVRRSVSPMSGGVPGAPGTTIYYAGAMEKQIDVGANVTTIRTYLPDGMGYAEEKITGTSVASTATATSNARFFLKDPLGSALAVVDDSAALLQRMSYDPWGRRRNADGTDDAWTSRGTIANAQDHTGFTGEEQLDLLGMVDLNGRVYDPMVARMLSADPTIPDHTDTQALNRYSYVLDNPLAYTDPSGFDADPSYEERENRLPDHQQLPPVQVTGTLPVVELPRVEVTGSRGFLAGYTMTCTGPCLDFFEQLVTYSNRLFATAGRGAVGRGAVGALVGAALCRSPACIVVGAGASVMLTGDTSKDDDAKENAKQQAKDALGANSSAAGGAASPPPNGEDNNDNKKNKDDQVASEKTSNDIHRRVERDLGKDARRELHDAKQSGSGDRTLGQLKQDARDLYIQAGKDIPSWLK